VLDLGWTSSIGSSCGPSRPRAATPHPVWPRWRWPAPAPGGSSGSRW